MSFLPAKKIGFILFTFLYLIISFIVNLFIADFLKLDYKVFILLDGIELIAYYWLVLRIYHSMKYATSGILSILFCHLAVIIIIASMVYNANRNL